MALLPVLCFFLSALPLMQASEATTKVDLPTDYKFDKKELDVVLVNYRKEVPDTKYIALKRSKTLKKFVSAITEEELSEFENKNSYRSESKYYKNLEELLSQPGKNVIREARKLAKKQFGCNGRLDVSELHYRTSKNGVSKLHTDPNEFTVWVPLRDVTRNHLVLCDPHKLQLGDEHDEIFERGSMMNGDDSSYYGSQMYGEGVVAEFGDKMIASLDERPFGYFPDMKQGEAIIFNGAMVFHGAMEAKEGDPGVRVSADIHFICMNHYEVPAPENLLQRVRRNAPMWKKDKKFKALEKTPLHFYARHLKGPYENEGPNKEKYEDPATMKYNREKGVWEIWVYGEIAGTAQGGPWSPHQNGAWTWPNLREKFEYEINVPPGLVSVLEKHGKPVFTELNFWSDFKSETLKFFSFNAQGPYAFEGSGRGDTKLKYSADDGLWKLVANGLVAAQGESDGGKPPRVGAWKWLTLEGTYEERGVAPRNQDETDFTFLDISMDTDKTQSKNRSQRKGGNQRRKKEGKRRERKQRQRKAEKKEREGKEREEEKDDQNVWQIGS